MNLAELLKAVGVDLTNFLADYGLLGAIVLVLLMSCIQAVPSIKLNPWTWLGKALGKAINGDLTVQVSKVATEVKAVSNELASMKSANEADKAVQARTRILRFGDEVYHGTRHSKEHFDQILLDITAYENYCSAHSEFQNNVTTLTVQRIKTVYQKCLSEDSFL